MNTLDFNVVTGIAYHALIGIFNYDVLITRLNAP